jgi:hypothetical protein
VSAGIRWSPLVVGVVFGFLLTASGLGDYTTIHDGLLLRNPYIFLMLGSAMLVAVIGLAVLRRGGGTAFAGRLTLPRSGIQRRHVYGGIVFGVGFGVGATCPGITIAHDDDRRPLWAGRPGRAAGWPRTPGPGRAPSGPAAQHRTHGPLSRLPVVSAQAGITPIS